MLSRRAPRGMGPLRAILVRFITSCFSPKAWRLVRRKNNQSRRGMRALDHSKIRARCLRFDFLPNQLDLIKAPGIRKKSAREPYAVPAPQPLRGLRPATPPHAAARPPRSRAAISLAISFRIFRTAGSVARREPAALACSIASSFGMLTCASNSDIT